MDDIATELNGAADESKAGAQHNHPPPTEAHKLLAEAQHSLRAHSRHDKEAIQHLHAFIVHVMKTCEYARQSPQNAAEVEHELWRARAPYVKDDQWFHPLVTAAFDEADRKDEKTNISKYVSVLSYAVRKGLTSATLPELLAKKGVSEIAHLEAEARRGENGARRSEKPDPVLERVIEKHRQRIELPGVQFADDQRFALLVIERTNEGLCLVAQATAALTQVRRYFADELRKGTT